MPMPETAVEFRLGQLDATTKALLNELRDMRSDVIGRIEQHDRRDDERFASHGTRLDNVEKKQAIDDAQAASGDKRRAGWQWLVQVLSAGVAGALANWALHK